MGYIKRAGLLLALALALALAACGGQQQAGMSQDDFGQSFGGYTSDIGQVMDGLKQDLALQALLDMPQNAPGPMSNFAVSLASLSGQNLINSLSAGTLAQRFVPFSAGALTYGRWVYNETTGDWVQDGNYTGDDLVLVWNFEDESHASHSAQLTADWNYQEHATVDAKDVDGSTVELPTDAYVSLVIDSSEAGHLRGQFTWYSGACGTIAEPTQATINGRFGDQQRLELNDIALSISDTQVSFTGQIKAVDGNDYASFDWSITANGHNVRGSDCFSERFDTTGGNVNLKSSEKNGSQQENSEFNTNFAVNYDNSNMPESLDLNNGYFKLNGQVALTFSGTLDDSNGNGVPGENVTVTFADGSTTLEELIMNSHN